MITIYEQTRQDILDHHNSIKGELKSAQASQSANIFAFAPLRPSKGIS
ncbi:hypothetical protein PO124_24410 [Bacillus licheniformis]|nr:hypothetical protein [Bacillus licheniformis]